MHASRFGCHTIQACVPFASMEECVKTTPAIFAGDFRQVWTHQVHTINTFSLKIAKCVYVLKAKYSFQTNKHWLAYKPQFHHFFPDSVFMQKYFKVYLMSIFAAPCGFRALHFATIYSVLVILQQS